MNKSLADHVDLIRLVKDAKRREKASKIGGYIGLFVAQVLLWPLGGWALMLLMGILHHEASPAVPTLGFLICLAIVVLASVVKSAVAPDFPEDK